MSGQFSLNTLYVSHFVCEQINIRWSIDFWMLRIQTLAFWQHKHENYTIVCSAVRWPQYLTQISSIPYPTLRNLSNIRKKNQKSPNKPPKTLGEHPNHLSNPEHTQKLQTQ